MTTFYEILRFPTLTEVYYLQSYTKSMFLVHCEKEVQVWNKMFICKYRGLDQRHSGIPVTEKDKLLE